MEQTLNKNNYLEVTTEVFSMPNSLKIKARINAHLNRSTTTTTDPLLKSNCTLPNIKKSSKTPKNLIKPNIFCTTPTNVNTPSYLFSQDISALSKETIKIMKINEPQTFKSDPAETEAINSLDEPEFKPNYTGYPKNSRNNGLYLANSTSPVRKSLYYTRFNFNDPYACSTIMKNHDFTPFQKLVSASGDSNTSSYPYFTRVSREIKKTEQTLVQKLNKKPKAYKECSCTVLNPRISNRQKPNQSDIQALCDDLIPFLKVPQESTFKDSLLIINFEGVIAHVAENKLKLRRGAVKFLSKVHNHFKIILVTNSQRIISTILSVMELKAIKLSGLYLCQGQKSKELANLQRIYTDFAVTEISKLVLVISSLNIEVHRGEPIFPVPQRIRQNLNVTMCPLATDDAPITFLIPHMLINISAKPFEALLGSLQLKTLRAQFNFQEWLKDNRIRFKIIRSTLPHEIIMEKMPVKTTNKLCNLHRKHIPQSEEVPFNYFVLHTD